MENKINKYAIIKSPLRYPGGKGSAYPFFCDLLKLNELVGAKYYEPYAGGAGVGLALLSLGFVSEIGLNDADYRIYCFWTSVLNENDRFIENVLKVNVSVDEWYKQKEIYANPGSSSVFDVGFSVFYLNRCNRSGVLSGAGPIGGYNQAGKWRIDARFNKKALVRRLECVGEKKGSISIENKDAIDYMRCSLKSQKKNKASFIYIDPPYFSAGNRLYLNYYKYEDHQELARYLRFDCKANWVLTYDENEYIRNLYGFCSIKYLTRNYSLQKKIKGKELLMVSNKINIPEYIK
ncbi:DNA adenine methylase [bacterium]|nr:DNA adenine methylase [bacterium]